MTLNFVRKNFSIGASNDNISPQLVFYKQGFEINGSRGSIDWQDIIISGNTALTLVNAKADGLNYLKLFGGCEQSAENLTSVTASGKCEQTGTPTPSNPISITCNNGVVSLSPNLFDKNTATILNLIRNGTTQRYEANNERYGVCLELEVGKTYTWSIDRNQSNLFINMGLSATYPSEGVECSYVAIGATNSTYTFTVTAETKYVYWWSTSSNFIDYMRVELGSNKNVIAVSGTVETITDSLGYSATVNNLYSLTNGTNTFTDVQEVLTGAISRNVGVKVFDGTEAWTYQSTNFRFVCDVGLKIVGNRTCPLLCTHYQAITDGRALADVPNYSVYGATSNNSVYLHDSRFTTASALTNYLQEQYSAGTPVILVYPLATPTSESVAGQALYREPLTVTGSLDDLVVNTTTASATPTPNATIPIICNNGELKVRNKNGVPDEYTQLEYLQSNGGASSGQCINTGVKADSEVVTYEWEYEDLPKTKTAGSSSLFGCEVTGKFSGVLYTNTVPSASDTAIMRRLYAGSAGVENYDFPFGSFIKCKLILNNGNYELYQNNVLVGQGTYEGTLITNLDIYLFSNKDSSSAKQFAKCKMKYFKITKSGNVACNLFPVKRNSDNAIGMYDTVSETFLTNAGTGSFTTGDVDYSAYEIYVDGTTETVKIKGKNLWDTNNFTYAGVDYVITKTTYGFTATARSGTATSSRVVVYIPVEYLKENTTYFLSGVTGVGNVYVGRTVNGVGDNGYYKDTGSSKKFTITDIAEGQTRFILTMYLGKATEGTVKDFSQIQLEEGTSATDYVIPFNGGTVTAEMLLAVSENYKDVQEVLTGEITRNVAVKVLDGTENWNTLTSSRGYYSQFPNLTGVPYNENSWCTHFYKATWATQTNPMSDNHFGFNKNANTSICNGNVTFKPNLTDIPTSADWKAFLANEYAKGTPVIVVYPLATPTTESVTGQTLTTQQGTNIIEITQASIDGLPLEVSYKAGVTVTVAEVENANLDDSVTVTIGE